jgi:hypothetical protein
MTRLRLIAAAAAMLLSAGGAGFADDNTMNPTVAVPSPGGGGGGGGVQGCWRIQGTIYGPYRMSFCLRGNSGSYQVNGGGLNCNGRLDWYPGRNGRVDIDLYRSACGGRGTDWTGDSLNCRTGWRVFGNQLPGVAVPAPPGPRGNTLNCTYVPQASGYSPIQVTARRI